MRGKEDPGPLFAAAVSSGTRSTRKNGVEKPWWKDKEEWKAHRETVRKNLEDFVNGVLARFQGTVRGGDHFVLDEARVKVVKCEPIPDQVFAEVRPRWDAGFPKRHRPKRAK